MTGLPAHSLQTCGLNSFLDHARQSFELFTQKSNRRLDRQTGIVHCHYKDGDFDRGHEPVLRTSGARFITFTLIENICRGEISRLLEE